MKLETYYLDQKDYILNLYKNKDYPTLEKVFFPYRKATVKSLKNNENFYSGRGNSGDFSGGAGKIRTYKAQRR